MSVGSPSISNATAPQLHAPFAIGSPCVCVSIGAELRPLPQPRRVPPGLGSQLAAATAGLTAQAVADEHDLAVAASARGHGHGLLHDEQPAGALDARFSRVWLMHGGGDNVHWVAGNLHDEIESDLLRQLVARIALFTVYGNSFDTRRWIPEIAPRPLIIVMARDDDFVPREAQQPMLEAARQPSAFCRRKGPRALRAGDRSPSLQWLRCLFEGL